MGMIRSKPYLVPFKAEHLKGMYGTELAPSKIIWEYETEGVAFTAISGGKPFACAGIKPVWNGVADLWFTHRGKKLIHPIWTMGVTKRMIIDVMNANGLWRTQTLCRVDNEDDQRFNELLGLTRAPGYQEKIGPDKADYLVYTRIM